VQHQRDIVRPGLRRTRIGERHGQSETAGWTFFIRRQLDDRNLALRRDCARGRIRAALDDQSLGVEIAEIEIELVGAIGGVERRGRSPACDRNESRRHLGPVRHDDGDRVALLNTQRPQCATGAFDQARQFATAHCLAVGGANGGGRVVTATQEVGNGLDRTHESSMIYRVRLKRARHFTPRYSSVVTTRAKPPDKTAEVTALIKG
jgi:hypothetical protein